MSPFQNFADHDGYIDRSTSRKRMYVADPDDDVDPDSEVETISESSNADSVYNRVGRLPPTVRGSGKRRQTQFPHVHSQSRAFSVMSQPQAVSRITQGGSETVQRKSTQHSTADRNNIAGSDSKNSEEHESALACNLSKSNQKQESQNPSQYQYQQGHSQAAVVTGSGKRFDHWEDGSESETSDASDTSESEIDNSDIQSVQSGETSSDSRSDDEETSSKSSLSEIVSKPSISNPDLNSAASSPKPCCIFPHSPQHRSRISS